MSSIIFDFLGNTAPLDKSLNDSGKKVGDWVKKVEAAGGTVDAGFKKMNQAFKDAIKDQKTLIKEMEKSISELQKAYDKATAGQQKSNLGVDLRSARTSLAGQNKILQDLQKEQIALNNTEEGTIHRLIGGLGKWVVGLVSVGAAMKLFKGIMESTETSSNTWRSSIQTAKNVLDLFMKSVATAGSGGFDNWNERLREAVASAKQFTDDMDLINNLQRSHKLKELDLEKEIGELKRVAYEDETTSNEKKLEAMDKIIAKVQEKADLEVDIATKLQWAIADKTTGINKITEDELKWAITNYEYIAGIGDRFNDLQKRLKNVKEGAKWGISLVGEKSAEELQKEIDALGPQAAAIGAIAAKLGEVNSKERDAMFQAMEKSKQAANAVYNETSRIWMRRSALKNRMAKEDEETAKTENKIKEQQELLNKAIDEGDDKQANAITARIKLLQDELTEREKIKKSLIENMGYEGFVPTTISTGGIKIPTLLQKPEKKEETAAQQWEKTSTQMSNLAPGSAEWAKKMQKAIDENDKKQIEALNKELDLRNQILNAATSLVYNIGQSIGLEQEQQEQLSGILDSFTQLVSGNIPGAVASLVSTVIGAFPSAADKYADEIERLNILLEEQTKIIEQSERKGGEEKARKDYIDSLKKQQEVLEAGIKRTEKSQFWFGIGKKANKEFEEQLKEVMDLIEEAQQDYNDFVTGGITENTIADIIVQGFQEGKTSVDDFADYMNQVLIDAVMSVFTDSLLSSPKMKAYMEWLKGAMTGGITDAEKEENARRIAEIAADNKAAYDAMVSGLDMGGNTAVNNGLSMGIQRSITEETGTEWVGLARRQADDLRTVKDYTLLGINNLTKIEANTYNTVLELQKAVTELQAINANTKQVPVAGF